MKVYIAGPWIHRDEARKAAGKFVEAGFEITEPWWNHEDVTETDNNAMELERQALLDIQGVLDADVLVLLNLAKSEGKAVEQGIALMVGVPIIGVGQRGSNIFQYLSAYEWVATVEEAIDAARRYS